MAGARIRGQRVGEAGGPSEGPERDAAGDPGIRPERDGSKAWSLSPRPPPPQRLARPEDE